jgi:hypothetical protein
MEDLTEGERVTLRDVLDIEIESFEDAMHKDTEQTPDCDRPKSWDELLARTGSYGGVLTDLRSIRKKVTG